MSKKSNIKITVLFVLSTGLIVTAATAYFLTVYYSHVCFHILGRFCESIIFHLAVLKIHHPKILKPILGSLYLFFPSIPSMLGCGRRRLMHLEEALLLLSRIDAGTLAFDRKPTDVFTLLSLASDNLYELFIQKGVLIDIPEMGEMNINVDLNWTMEFGRLNARMIPLCISMIAFERESPIPIPVFFAFSPR